MLIAAERSPRSEAGLDALIDDLDDPAIAAITVAELRVGVELATGSRRGARQRFLTELLDSVEVVSYDVDVAIVHSQLLAAVRRSGRPRGAHDLIIAATALATGRVVVTADRSGFTDLPGLELRSPE